VADFLQHAGILLKNKNRGGEFRQTLLGSSAGSLVSAGILAGLRIEDMMTIVSQCATDAREAGLLSAISPKFSLLDSLNPKMRTALEKSVGKDAKHTLSSRVNGDQLRIFLTNPRSFVFPRFTSHVFVNEFSSVEHLMAACTLSSYIPLATGPVNPKPGDSVHSATELMRGQSLVQQNGAPNLDGRWWDGGLSMMWPSMDERTILVSPVAIRSKSNIVICPEWNESAVGLPTGQDGLIINATLRNAVAANQMLIPADDTVYDKVYAAAYDDAKRVCEMNGLL
jgi:hypothetical protein